MWYYALRKPRMGKIHVLSKSDKMLKNHIQKQLFKKWIIKKAHKFDNYNFKIIFLNKEASIFYFPNSGSTLPP